MYHLLMGLLVLAGCAISYLITCGIMALICMCFSWEFSWLVATGIWLIMFLAKSVFGGGKK